RIQFNDEIILYTDDEDGDYLDSNENNRLIGVNDEFHHKIRRKEKKNCNACPTLGIVLMCILVSLYIFLYNVYTSNSPSRAVSISGWDRNTTRDTASYIFPSVNTTLIEPPNVCSDKLFVLVVVCSSAVNHDTRQAIRETWGNLTEFNYSFFAKMHKLFSGTYLNIKYKDWRNYSISENRSDYRHQDFAVKILFLVGQTPSNETQLKINTESETYGDVIQESFLDTYNNLTLKTVMMLKWVNKNCQHKTKFLMKCDDDTFVNIPNLLHILLGGTVPVYNATIQEYDQHSIQAKLGSNRLTQYKDLLLGLRFCNSKPIANISSKWYTPMYMYSGNIYPAYLSGTGYVMSMDVVEKLYRTSLSTPLFHLEDVYLTGICAKSANIKPRNHQLFSYQSYKNMCELKGMNLKRYELMNEVFFVFVNVYVFIVWDQIEMAPLNVPNPDGYKKPMARKSTTLGSLFKLNIRRLSINKARKSTTKGSLSNLDLTKLEINKARKSTTKSYLKTLDRTKQGITMHPKSHRRGVVALREIRYYQNSTKLIIPKAPFHRLIREITERLPNAKHFRYQHAAMEGLQEAAESYLVGVLKLANLLAIHAKRVSITSKDIRFATHLKFI
ncbi:Beta-1,3-galactosyltransferase 1, partial [Pseudolycoriella hygida]